MELRSKIIEVKICLKTFKEKIRDSRIKAERIDLKKYIYIKFRLLLIRNSGDQKALEQSLHSTPRKKNPVDQDVYIPKKNIL